jgi:VWFA-related protein
MPRRIAPLLLALLLAVPASAQEGTVQLSGAEVLLDLVVTDSKGRASQDLRADEVQVFEQGERQEVTSFGLLRVGPRAAGEAASTAPGSLALSPFRQVNLVMIVVDRTSIRPVNLKAIHDAARGFVEKDLAPNDLVAVFAVGSRLLMVQNFSNNRDVLFEAIRRATAPFDGPGDAVLTADANARRTRLDPIRPALPVAPGGADPAAGIQPAVPTDTLTPLLNDIAANTEAAVAYVEEQVQSESFVRGLFALLKLYGGVRDRKSVVLYSEGVSITSARAPQFASLISLANRSSFTFYTVDAAGLRTGAGADVKPAEPRTIGQQNDTTRDRTLVSRGDSELGRAERELRTNDNAALNRLASDTGGLFVKNTNDLERGFERLAADLRSHYALTYAPKNAEFDGSFRAIEVKVSRKDARVRTRNGYFAVPGGPGSLLMPWEQPALALIGAAAARRPADLKAGVRVDRFAAPDGWLVPVLVSVAGEGLEPLPKPKDAKADEPDEFEVDVVALVRDASRNVVAKMSRRNVLGVPKDRLSAFRGTYYTLAPFADRVVLGAGSYTAEVAIYDPSSKRATVVERAFTLGEAPPAGVPASSSLVLGRGAVKVDAAAGDPFVVPGGARGEPSPDARFVKALGDRLVPYVRLYGKPGVAYRVKVDFVRAGKVVITTGELALPVDEKGEAVVARAFGLDAFAPADYTARVTIVVPDGAPIVLTADFRVE